MTDTAEIVSLVLSQIPRIPGSKKAVPDGMSICCPFHKDTNPSCNLNTSPNKRYRGKPLGVGVYFCFSCGAKGGWNSLADKLGLKKIDENGAAPTTETFYKRELQVSTTTDVLDMDSLLEGFNIDATHAIPLNKKDEWRTFSGRFLSRFKVQDVVDDTYGDRHLVFPVMVGREIVGGIKARWEKKEGYLSYINSRGSWTKDIGLFPYDQVKKMRPKCVFLVEGPRDALRLLKYGIPALCILGTQNWSEAKRDLIVALGVDRVVLLMDGDEAGIKCYRMIRPTFVGHVECKVAKLRPIAKKLKLKKLDPCDTPKEWLSKLVKKFHLK